MKLILSKEYLELINNAKKRNPKEIIYGENHHIYMKSLSGENSETVRLTYEEHYLAHKYLALANPDIKQCQSAWWNMCQCTKDGRIIASEEDYAEARRIRSEQMSGDNNVSKREEVRKKQSENHADFSGPNNPMFGKHHTDEAKEKSRQVNLGRKKSEGAGRQPIKIYALEYPNIIFDSYADAERKSKELEWTCVSKSGIYDCFHRNKKSCGKDEKGNKLHWIKCSD